jgi:uncharacterized protein YbjT (DUF2867 family)
MDHRPRHLVHFSEGNFADDVIAGTVALPVGDIREPFIDADDLADVAVAALTDDRRLFRRHDVHYAGPVHHPLDTLDSYAWQPEQQCRTVGQGPWSPSSVRLLRNFQTSEGQGPPHATTHPMRAKSQLPA